MQKVKIGTGIVIGVVAMYAITSFTIFYFKKPSLDQQLSIENQVNVKSQKEIEGVVIQAVDDQQEENVVCPHQQDQESFDTQNDQIPETMSSTQDFGASSDSYSFVTMPAQDCVIDKELLYLFDMLIGQDLDEFVRLVLQSNNNIVSKQACRSCTMYAFFSKIKKHQPLTVQDIATLQPLLANLYRFVQNMKKISGVDLLRSQQFAALEDLNRTESVKNDMKLQARKAVTAAALKKLQSIKYR